jgi:hypothetical protein
MPMTKEPELVVVVVPELSAANKAEEWKSLHLKQTAFNTAKAH